MKDPLLTPRRKTPQVALAVLLPVGLTGALWIVTLPVAMARLMTPTEMIEAGLPPGVVMKTANKPQFLTAVCAAVKNNRKSAPAIARTAVGAHREYAGDIVATVVRCSNGNCELTGAIVAAATSAAPDYAVAIDDAAVAVAPDCADAIQGTTVSDGKEVRNDGKEVLPGDENVPAEGPSSFSGAPPIGQQPILGGIGGGGNPQDATIGVCDNGRQRRVPVNRLTRYLANHPGSYVGTCQITPVASR